MFFKKICLLIVITACASGIAVYAKKNPNKLVIASDCTWPPMEFIDEHKQTVGFDIDLIKAIAKAAGFEVEIKNSAWDGIFAGLAAGKYDAVISSVTINDERKKTMDFSNPYLNAGQVLIVRKDAKNISKMTDLKGKTAGAQIGTTGASEIDKVGGIKKKTYDEIGLGIEDLFNKRIDAIICDKPTAVSYALKNAKYKQSLEIRGEPFTAEFYGIAIKKGNSEILDKINRGLNSIKKSGELKRIEDKWLK